MLSSQQILCDRLLLAVINGQESNFNGGFKLKIYNNLLVRIYYKNIMNVVFFKNLTLPPNFL